MQNTIWRRRISIILITLLLSWDGIIVIAPLEASSGIGLKFDNIAKNAQKTAGSSPFLPGEGIFVDTFPDTSFVLNGNFAIDQEGMVEFPMIGKIKVTDLSQRELEEFLKSQFSNFMKYPMVRVKPVMRISILGGVKKPGLFYVDGSNSLWEIIQMAGGPTFEDGFDNMVWERDHSKISSDLIPYLEKSTSLNSMGFKSGDQIWTPVKQESFWTFFAQSLLPLMSFVTTLVLFYYTYQRDLLYLQSTQRK
jgi:hypothetical protein